MTQKSNYSIIIIVKEIKKKGCDKMTIYLHIIYNDEHSYFSFDEWSEKDQCFYGIDNYSNIDGRRSIADIYKMAEMLGAKKLILDF